MQGIEVSSMIGRSRQSVKLSGPHVLLLARYGTAGASSRVRHYAQIPYLEERGFTFEINFLIDNESIGRFYAGRSRRWERIATAYAQRLALLTRWSSFDLIWIEKEALPGLPWELEKLFYRRKNTIVDFDDLWVNRFSEGEHPIATRKLRSVLQAARTVTSANKQLAEILGRISGRQITILPNAIDADLYDAFGKDAGHASKAPVRIGWIGTPYTAAKYLPRVSLVLNRLSCDGVSVTQLIGAGDAVPDLVAERVPWTSDGEAAAVAALDIGIVPLGRNAFDACKSGWKILQYMAAGRPVVATRVGYNAELILDGHTGFLVETQAEWEFRLRQLAADPALRMKLGAAAQAMVTQNFGRLTNINRLEEIMLSLRVQIKATKGEPTLTC
jgi:glycosyltransferase involved in cell wall biosynthesis